MEPKHKRSEIQTQVMNIIAILDFFVLQVIFYEIIEKLILSFDLNNCFARQDVSEMI